MVKFAPFPYVRSSVWESVWETSLLSLVKLDKATSLLPCKWEVLSQLDYTLFRAFFFLNLRVQAQLGSEGLVYGTEALKEERKRFSLKEEKQLQQPHLQQREQKERLPMKDSGLERANTKPFLIWLCLLTVLLVPTFFLVPLLLGQGEYGQ